MREKHLFEFTADKIRRAAEEQAAYHTERMAFWKKEYETALDVVKKTASIEVKEYDVSGGKRADVSINYGDASAYSRMQEAFHKIHSHRQDAERFTTDAQVYGSQSPGRIYELETADVHYFRLGGGQRPE